jgi:RNA polymerase sigma factor (sigma-70 family)
MIEARKNLKKNARKMLGKNLRASMCVGSSDLVQETLMVTVMNLSEVIGRPKRAVYHWMISVMRYRILKHARAEKVRKREQWRFLSATEVEEGFDLDRELINTELKELVLNKLASMSVLSRRIFVLRYFEGYQLQQIADEVGLSKAAVRGNIYRTLEKIRDELKDSIL